MLLTPKVAFLLSLSLGCVLYFTLDRSGWESIVVTILGFLGFGGFRPTVIALKTLPRDIQIIVKMLKLEKILKRYQAQNETLSSLFFKTLSRHPTKTAILFEDQKWSFQDLENYSNKVANLFLKLGLKHNDTVALFMTNCPEYVGILLGANKIGVGVALINYNLRENSLHHSMTVAGSVALIYENSLEEAVSNIHDQLDENLQSMCFCACGNANTSYGQSFDSEVESMLDTPPLVEKNLSSKDIVCYIYTSGTTGLPKAVPIKQIRFFSFIIIFQLTVPFTADDIVYDTLPLYHSNGGVIAMGQALLNGSTVALRRKFSASQFWNDCIKYKCTVFVYIGEICRYVLLQPPQPTDTQHSISKAIGNGLRPEIWSQFQKRFNIPRIVEFYGATESNFALINMVGKVGAVGYNPILFGFLMKSYIIKVDLTTGDVVRDSNGHCIQVPLGENGEMISRIIKNDVIGFDGYKNKEANTKKILHNVFKKGDQYYRSGDLARMDEEGFIYFCDRAGDTFRWKGENVSTTEVENTIANIVNQKEVVVFGVEIPGADGRIGMACIVGTPDSINISQLAKQLYPLLPAYAIPGFIRLVENTQITGTFKFQKTDYRKEGYDIGAISDELFVLDSAQKMYVPLTEDLYKEVLNGKVKF